MPKDKLARAFVIIKKDWVTKHGLNGLLARAQIAVAEQPEMVLALSDYKLMDSWFAEIEFYGRTSKDRKVKVYVPKHEIVTLFLVETKEDAESIGFKLAWETLRE
jgi:hypothetical protein